VAPAQVPDAPEARAAAERGQALYEQREYAAALTEFEIALAGGVRDGRTLFMAGDCQRKTGKPREEAMHTLTEAVTALDRVVRAGEPELTDYALLSSAYAAVGDLVTASQVAAEALKTHQQGAFGAVSELPPAALIHLGDLAGRADDSKLHVETFRRAADLLSADEKADAGDLSRALSGLGEALLEAGEAPEASQILARLLELRQDYPGARVSYARALFRAGEYKAAGEQWNTIRVENPALSTEANYARMVLATLSQKDLLLDRARPLEDISLLSRGDLEDRMRAEGQELGVMAAGLPEEMVRKGHRVRDSDAATKAAMKKLRDQKLRLSWTAGEYIHRGHPIREFAITNGLQAFFRPWDLPRMDRGERQPGPIPTHVLTPEQAAEFEARQARILEKRAERDKKRAERDKKRAARQQAREQKKGEGGS
jgi:tetratricopeptide (TPR) repeat protein